ncbi:MDR family MFS transporter [Longispora sp. NPDC051575]|uniref:MDR family MFS transporter n=1 Tax=Longispora sp. NPDC051575 TaxID=3154943 RepID=UPI00341AC605
MVTQTEPSTAERRAILAVLPGLVLVMLLAMLDNTIVGTAMPTIVGDLGGMQHFAWVATSYILASTITTPLYGKLGDLYGRKKLFITAILIFLAGSALSGLAQDMTQLIAFRAVQGLGAGGLMVGVMAIIGDLVPPRDRGKYQGYFAAVMALAMVGGPLVGGFFTDHISWRWCFYVNVPLGAIALFMIMAKLHTPKNTVKHKIDYLGIALLSGVSTALVLLTTWAGTEYAWGSPQIIGLAVAAGIGLGLFLWVELRATEPVLPLNLFTNRNFSLTAAIGFFQGFAMFGAIMFLPLFQQLVQHSSATNSGLLLLPLMFGMMSASMVAGQVITKTGKYRWFPFAGGIVMTAGMLALSTIDVDTSKLTTSLYMVVLGVGMGLIMQIVGMIAQNSVGPKDMGVASSTSMFFRSIGGAFGVSIFGAIFTHTLRSGLSGLPTDVADKLASSGARMNPADLAQLTTEAKTMFGQAVADATATVFGWGVVFTVLSVLLAIFIQHVPLRGGASGASDGAEKELVEA